MPAIPGLNTTLSINYNDGALTIAGEVDYERGMLSGHVELGATSVFSAPGRPQPLRRRIPLRDHLGRACGSQQGGVLRLLVAPCAGQGDKDRRFADARQLRDPDEDLHGIELVHSWTPTFIVLIMVG